MTKDSQDEVIAFLSNPATHGGNPVGRMTTHGAHIFLAGDRVIKLKRAVKFPFMDYSTVERRHLMLMEEFRINRDTAEDLYLAVEPITRRENSLHLGGSGDIVDWVLIMRRFAQSDLLDDMAQRGALPMDIMEPLTDKIVKMHRSAPIVARAESTVFSRTALENVEALRHCPIDQALVAEITAKLERACTDLRSHLDTRARRGFVRRCHGDLHLRNIVCWKGSPLPFDALEFDPALASGDVLYDLAFLLMDLDHRSLREHANRVLNRYLSQTDDLEGLKALPLFLSVRAVVRAKVAGVTGSLPNSDASARYQEAIAYLRQATGYLPGSLPRLVAIGGLSGTGKTQTAKKVAPALLPAPGAIIIRSDVVRKNLAGVAATSRLGQDGYTSAATTRVYKVLAEKAKRCLAAGYSCILDAVFARPSERFDVEALASDLAVPFTGYWLAADLETRITRVSARTNDASDANATVARRQEDYDLGNLTWVSVDANGSVDQTAAQILAPVVPTPAREAT